MINIIRYRELLVELQQAVNDKQKDAIDSVVLAVREGHMTKKLRERQGVVLCSNYPDAHLQGSAHNYSDSNKIYLFVLEKVPSGKETDEEELQHYGRLQEIMRLLRDALLTNDTVCGEIKTDEDITTEWEYDIFGGWNGLSIGLTLHDYE